MQVDWVAEFTEKTILFLALLADDWAIITLCFLRRGKPVGSSLLFWVAKSMYPIYCPTIMKWLSVARVPSPTSTFRHLFSKAVSPCTRSTIPRRSANISRLLTSRACTSRELRSNLASSVLSLAQTLGQHNGSPLTRLSLQLMRALPVE